jgi:hypothetical protein
MVKNMMTRKNMNCVISLIVLYFAMIIVSYVVPRAFVYLYDTNLGKLVMLVAIIAAGMKCMTYGVGLAIVFYVFYVTVYVRRSMFLEGMENKDKKKEKK